MKFYTFAQQYGNHILYRGIENGISVIEKVPFKPTLYIPGKNAKSGWKSLYDSTPLDPVEFGDIKEAKAFIETYKDVEGISVHGFQKFQYQFINQTFPNDIQYDLSKLNILTYDLEVINPEGESAFPDVRTADTPIVTCAFHSSIDNKTMVYGVKAYTRQPDDNFEYVLFDNEKEMLKGIVLLFQTSKPHVITGWNTETFDTPYLINRIMRILDESWVKKLSPFGIVNENLTTVNDKEIQTYNIFGVVELDYLLLYKKYGTYSAKESYTLGFIAQEELGETKVELPGISFYENYTKFHTEFIRYNSVDVDLVQKMEKKMRLIELAFAIAYMYHSNIVDVFKTVLPWEVFIFNHLAKDKIAVPPKRHGVKAEFEGAWVKDPLVGLHGWTMSWDFSSLYPSIIRQWNISPETFVSSEINTTVDDWIQDNKVSKAAVNLAIQKDCAVAANGTMYKKDYQGFLPALMEYCMIGRKVAKTEMLKLENEYQITKNEELLSRISELHNKQMALKISANSVYGAVGNSGFHYYDSRQAEAITLSGQYSDINLANKINAKLNKILKTNNVDYIISGDTDSVYANVQPIVDLFAPTKTIDQIVAFLDRFGKEVIQPVINESVNEIFDKMNCFDKVMDSKREAIASKVLYRAKKNYAMYVHNSEGVSYDPPKLKVLGIEIVRSNTPQWCRKNLKKSLLMIFESNEKELQKKFLELEKEFKTLPAHDIGRPSGVSDISKHFDGIKIKDSKSVPMHVRAAINYNIACAPLSNLEQIVNGGKIKYVYLKMPNPIKQNVIGFPSHSKLPAELKLDKYIDYNTQFEKTFENPLKSLTDVAKWSLRDESDLTSFFG